MNWLSDFSPELDTCMGVEKEFDSFENSSSSIIWYLDTEDNSYVTLNIGDLYEETGGFTNFLPEEIEKALENNNLRVYNGTTNGFWHWSDGNPSPLSAGFLLNGFKIILIVNKDNNSGKLFVSDNCGWF